MKVKIFDGKRKIERDKKQNKFDSIFRVADIFALFVANFHIAIYAFS